MHEEMNVKNILLGDWQNLLNIKRLSVKQVINPLTVAEHSWLVAMLVMRMCDEIFVEIKDKLTFSEYEIFIKYQGRMVQASLMHDIEEAIIGDIPKIPCGKEMSRSLKTEAIHLVNKDLFDNTKGLHYNRLRVYADSCKLVKYCDLYSLLIECIREIEMGNNTLIEVTGKALYLMEKLVNGYIKIEKNNIEQFVAEYMKGNYYNTKIWLEYQYHISIKPVKW